MHIPTTTGAAAYAVIGCCVAVACSGGSSAPTAPSGGPTTAPSSCRIYPTAQRSVTTAGSFTSNTSTTSSFNVTTRQGTLTTQLSDSSGCGGTATSVATYASLSDFVDEVGVIPPLILETGSTTTTAFTGTCSSASGTSTATFTHSGQRLTGFTVGGVTTTYTAWDGSSRPTAGTIAGGGPQVAVSYTYNDAARTATLTAGAGGSAATTVTTYDANGNQILAISTSGSSVSTTTTTVLATATVCK